MKTWTHSLPLYQFPKKKEEEKYDFVTFVMAPNEKIGSSIVDQAEKNMDQSEQKQIKRICWYKCELSGPKKYIWMVKVDKNGSKNYTNLNEFI